MAIDGNDNRSSSSAVAGAASRAGGRAPHFAVKPAVRVGFVGLGQMGRHMALNLHKRGVDLLVGARTSSRFGEFESRGVMATTDLRDLGVAETVFLCVPNGSVARDVLLGVGGVAHEGSRVRVVIDTSTTSYAEATALAADLAAREIEYLDAPVSGMEARAADATLTMMCGGKRSTFDAAAPLLACVASQILYMGEHGSGQLAKLVNQLLFNINAAALAEVLPMATRLGLDPDTMSALVNGGTGRSYASEFFLPRVLENDFSQGYSMTHAYKDMVNAAEICARHCIPLPLVNAALTTYQTALLSGHGALDKGGMIRVFEDLLKVRFRTRQVAAVTADGARERG